MTQNHRINNSLPYLYLVSLVLALTFFYTPASAKLTIEITRGNDNAIPVAIVPFNWSGEDMLPEDVASILNNDFKLSGTFKTVDNSVFLSYPQFGDIIHYSDWKQIGADYVVVGKITYKNGNYEINYQVHNTNRKTKILEGKINSTATILRPASHKISDKIYEEITNTPGIFSTKILYVVANRHSQEHTDYELVYADMDGYRPEIILQSNQPILAPSWAPNAQKIAYVSFEAGRPAIYVQELATGKREKMTNFKGLNSSPVWSPDGRELALVLSKSGNPDIYTMNVSTKKIKRITHHFAIDNEPAWMPSGDPRLIFTSNRSGSAQIYELNMKTDSIKRLTFSGKFNARAKVFPDGKAIALVHKGVNNKSDYNIAVLNRVTGRLDILTSTPFEDSPSISPNGQMLIYSAQDGNKGVLGIISKDGKSNYRIPSTDGDVREPSWSPYIN